MPSKLQHEFDKLRGKIAVTGKVYKDTMSDLEDQISVAKSTIIAVETNLKAAIRQNKAKATSESAHAANTSLPASGGKMTGELDMDRHDLIGVSDLECGDTGGIGFYSTTHALTATLDNSGNFTPQGNTDGRDLVTDGNKLDTIETSATADQTNTEIRDAVEAATDSNTFNDADHTKLNGVASGADVTNVTNVAAAGAVMDADTSISVDTISESGSDNGVTIDNLLIKDQSIKTSHLHLYSETINQYASSSDDGGIIVNFNGYQGGTTKFRNFSMYNGKNVMIAKFDGSSANLAIDDIVELTGAHGVTVDGRDVGTDGTKLDGIEVGAEVTSAAKVRDVGAVMTLYGFISGSGTIPNSTVIGSLPAHSYVLDTFCQTLGTWNGTDTAGYIGYTGDLDAYGVSTSILGAIGIIDLPAGTGLGYSTSTREVRIGVNGTDVTQGNVVMGIRYMVVEP